MLEIGNFASVEYIDDITMRDEKINDINSDDTTKLIEESLNSDIIPTIQLEYTSMIKEYILNNKYESDKIKNGVLMEFNEIINIYDSNYKPLSDN